MDIKVSSQVADFVETALECSIYIAPDDPGLTYAEIEEAGRRPEFAGGEIRDALKNIVAVAARNKRLLCNKSAFTWGMFSFLKSDPDYRNYDAFDFLHKEFAEIARSRGSTNANIERSVLVEQAATA
jgi:hypothetical protein